MTLLKDEIFVCLDCETTGLEAKEDRVIEVGLAIFTFDGIQERYETLIDPMQPIPEESMEIHHITNEMVQGKPKIQEILPIISSYLGKKTIVGHGINLDIDFLTEEAKRHGQTFLPRNSPRIDTLRLARLYGESPSNSLEKLREHFNIEPEGAHRAMNDVLVNIEVFKFLSSKFKNTKEILKRLEKPIVLKAMPLGKHKGRPFHEIPVEYLIWASHKDFDQDLLFSIQNELRRRKKGNLFEQASNPFSNL